MIKNLIVLLLIISTPLLARIIYPGGSTTEIKLADSLFTILLDFNDVDSIIIRSKFIEKKLLIDSIASNITYDNFTHIAGSTLVYTKMPKNIPFDLYDIVAFKNGKEDISKNSLQAIESYPKEMRIIHITDPHIGNTWMNNHAYELDHIQPLLNVIDIINPDLIFCTGDNIMNILHYTIDMGTSVDNTKPANTKEVWDNFLWGYDTLRGLKDMNSPLFVTTGNHDYRNILSKTKEWNMYMGKRVYGFSYGNRRIISMDDYLGNTHGYDDSDYPDSQIVWQNKFLEEEGHGTFRILAQHHSDKVSSEFCDVNKIDLALCGHTHANYKFSIGATPTQLYMTGSASHYRYVRIVNIGWFRIITIKDSAIVSAPSMQYGDPLLRKQELTLTFENKNNGSASQNKATLINNLSSNFKKCRVRFVMKKGEYSYNSHIPFQEFSNDSQSVIDFYVDINSKDTIEILCSKILSNENLELSKKQNIIMTILPNPFNPQTTISIKSLKNSSEPASLSIYNLQGKKVYNRDFIDLTKDQTIRWNADNLSSTLYLVTLKTSLVTITKTVIYLR